MQRRMEWQHIKIIFKCSAVKSSSGAATSTQQHYLHTLHHCILFQLIVWSFLLHFVNYHFPFYFKFLWNKGMFQTVSLLDTKPTSLAVSLKTTFRNGISGLYLKVYLNFRVQLSLIVIRLQQLFLLILFRTIQ